MKKGFGPVLHITITKCNEVLRNENVKSTVQEETCGSEFQLGLRNLQWEKGLREDGNCHSKTSVRYLF